MTTFTADRAASTFPVYGGTHGNLRAAYGTIEITANPADGDIYQMCRLPAGAVVLGGWLMGDDLDTNATETLDIDIGWAANGSDAADPDGFGNLGVLVGDAVTGYLPEGGLRYPLMGVLKDGPKTFVNETVIQLEANAAAATGGTGTVTIVVLYIVP